MNFKLILLFAAAALAIAAPELQDMHETGVALKLVSHVKNHDVFAITVKRVDDLSDVDKNGKVTELGLKVSQVILTFDVDSTTGVLTCNSQPIPYGLSMLKVEADVTTGVKKSALLTMTEEQVKASFDKGILSIKITASGQKIELPNGKTLQRILIKEQIAELNGKEIQESEIIQQVIEVYPSGKVLKSNPMIMPHKSTASPSSQLDTSPTQSGQHHQHHGKPHKLQSNHHHQKALLKAGKWFKSQSPVIQVASVMGLGAIIGLVSLVLFQLFALALMSIGLFSMKKKVIVGDAEMGEKSGFIDGDSGDVEGDVDVLPGYQHNGYKSVEKNDL